MANITIIDYGMGNLRSVQKRFEQIGATATISKDLKEIEKADKLVLPGVGQFGSAIKNLRELNMLDLLHHKVVERKTPCLGICLGMQLMAKSSEEGDQLGLGWFDANVVKFNVQDKLRYKIPHIGWNNIIVTQENPLLKNIDPQKKFYFVHSYHIKCNNLNDILTETEYEYTFVSSIWKDNIFGVQFHPEKSHEQGSLLLKNFYAF